MSRLLRLWRSARKVGRPRLPPVQSVSLPEFAGRLRQQEIAVSESLVWLNTTFKGLWPNANAAVQRLVHEQVTHQIQAQMPAMFSGVHFSKFTLGETPPVLGPVKVYTETNGGIRMTLAINFESDADICIKTGLLSVGLKALRFSGELVVRLDQLLNEMPVIGGVVIYFLNPPKIDFTLTGIGRGAQFPGLRGCIRRALDGAVNTNVVLPNQIAIPVGSESQGVDRAELMLAKPLGILRVCPVCAQGLRAPDWEEAEKEAADAYVVLKTADTIWESTVAETSESPQWPENECGDFFVYDYEQRIWATVYDRDHGETTDFIGSTVDIPIRDALRVGDEPFQLMPTEHACPEDLAEEDVRGELTMNFRFLEFVPDELVGDKLVLCVKVDAISLPPRFSSRVRLVATISPIGDSKSTPFGKETVRHEGGVAVSDLLRTVIQRADSKGLPLEDIAEITNLDEDEVSAVLSGGQVTEDAVLSKTKRLVRVDGCLFFAFPRELMEEHDGDDEFAVNLSVVDTSGETKASVRAIGLCDLAQAEHFAVENLWQVPTPEGDGEEMVEIHASLTLMGTQGSEM